MRYLIFLLLCVPASAQTTKDLFVMAGSDFVRPGLYPRSNLSIGIGVTLGKLSRVRVGDEITFGYTYENSGSSGFWNSDHGAHTEALGLMKNMPFPKVKWVGIYSWEQVGITSFTGSVRGVQNRMYNGEALGLAIHLTPHNGIWMQEAYNKVATAPWYTSTGIGYTLSW